MRPTARAAATAGPKPNAAPGHEVVIGGWTTTSGHLRSLLVGVHRGRHLIHLGRVGTGFGQDKAQSLLPALKALAAKQNSLHRARRADAGVRRALDQARAGRRDRVRRLDRGRAWCARQLSRDCARTSRPTKSRRKSRRERRPPSSTPKPAAVRPRPGKPARRRPTCSGSGKAVVMGVTISHPDKALWPERTAAGPVTKLDLAHYLRGGRRLDAAAHLKGRPCSIIRAPDGIGGRAASSSATPCRACRTCSTG